MAFLLSAAATAHGAIAGVEHAGHQFGWKTSEYFSAVEKVDGLIGDVLKAIEEAGVAETTVVLVTADHGGKGKGHGNPTMEEIEIPWIISGPGAKAGEIKPPVNTFDTAATVAFIFGLRPPDCWLGKPLGAFNPARMSRDVR